MLIMSVFIHLHDGRAVPGSVPYDAQCKEIQLRREDDSYCINYAGSPRHKYTREAAHLRGFYVANECGKAGTIWKQHADTPTYRKE